MNSSDLLPEVLIETQFAGLALWQWIGVLLLALLAYVASGLLARLLATLLRPAVSRSRSDFDDRILSTATGPIRFIAMVAVFSATLVSLELAEPAQRLFNNLGKGLSVVGVTWLVLRLADLFGDVIERSLQERGQWTATTLVPHGRRAAKGLLVVLGGLAALDTFGFDVTALIAGLGVGGLAVALGLQKTLENLFGGVALLADRPVAVGDFCRFGDKIGVVEEIGLRSTRVRTLDRTLVTVPNADFSTMQLENFAARDKIWYHPRIGLRYETTPDQLRYVLVEVRRMLYAHPKVDPDPARIRFVGFGAFSLDLDIFAYVLATDYAEYLEVAEDVNLRIMDIVDASGTGFAFPSSTTYLAKDDGLDAERSREAEKAVADWRGRGELFLPRFPPEEIGELRGSLRYPNEGSPHAKSLASAQPQDE